MYNKFINFYDNYFKNHIKNELWLNDNIKVVYTISITIKFYIIILYNYTLFWENVRPWSTLIVLGFISLFYTWHIIIIFSKKKV